MNSLQKLRSQANALARRALAPVPLEFWELTVPKDVVALCYHVVSDEDLPHLQLYPYKNSAQFEADVAFARDRAVTYRQVVDRRTNGNAAPRNGILFTFDDGLVQCYDIIRPVLLRQAVDGVFFVTTDYLDDRESFFESKLSLCLSALSDLSIEEATNVFEKLRKVSDSHSDVERIERGRRRLSGTRLRLKMQPQRRKIFEWAISMDDGDRELDELCDILGIDLADYVSRSPIFMSRANVRQLVADGFTVGAHGRKHQSFEHFSPLELEREIVASCEAVAEITGQARVPFAFPYSGLKIDRKQLAEIINRNPIVELLFDSGCLRSDPRFIVNRVFADLTPDPGVIASNVPTVLRDAWSVPSAWIRSY